MLATGLWLFFGIAFCYAALSTWIDKDFKFSIIILLFLVLGLKFIAKGVGSINRGLSALLPGMQGKTASQNSTDRDNPV